MTKQAPVNLLFVWLAGAYLCLKVGSQQHCWFSQFSESELV